MGNSESRRKGSSLGTQVGHLLVAFYREQSDRDTTTHQFRGILSTTTWVIYVWSYLLFRKSLWSLGSALQRRHRDTGCGFRNYRKTKTELGRLYVSSVQVRFNESHSRTSNKYPECYGANWVTEFKMPERSTAICATARLPSDGQGHTALKQRLNSRV